jgi:hypothetical protein
MHIRSSPTPLTLEPAHPDIARCELSGEGLYRAVAGSTSQLLIACRDTFGNEPRPDTHLSFGLTLLPPNTTTANKESCKTTPSIHTDGQWSEKSFMLSYEAHSAGDWELYGTPTGRAHKHEASSHRRQSASFRTVHVEE